MLWVLVSSLACTPASTAATPEGWTIIGEDGAAMHTHGGAPARLGDARFQVTWAGPGPAPLTVSAIEFLQDRSCDQVPTTVRSRPAFGGLFVNGMRESAQTITIEPGTPTVVDVSFPAVEAYYTWCERFAFRVTFLAGTTPVSAVAETLVTREEPLRPEVAR